MVWQGSIWYIRDDFGKFRIILVHWGFFWYIECNFGTLRVIIVHWGSFWYIGDLFGTLHWGSFYYVEIHFRTLGFINIDMMKFRLVRWPQFSLLALLSVDWNLFALFRIYLCWPSHNTEQWETWKIVIPGGRGFFWISDVKLGLKWSISWKFEKLWTKNVAIITPVLSLCKNGTSGYPMIFF